MWLKIVLCKSHSLKFLIIPSLFDFAYYSHDVILQSFLSDSDTAETSKRIIKTCQFLNLIKRNCNIIKPGQQNARISDFSEIRAIFERKLITRYLFLENNSIRELNAELYSSFGIFLEQNQIREINRALFESRNITRKELHSSNKQSSALER